MITFLRWRKSPMFVEVFHTNHIDTLMALFNYLKGELKHGPPIYLSRVRDMKVTLYDWWGVEKGWRELLERKDNGWERFGTGHYPYTEHCLKGGWQVDGYILGGLL